MAAEGASGGTGGSHILASMAVAIDNRDTLSPVKSVHEMCNEASRSWWLTSKRLSLTEEVAVLKSRWRHRTSADANGGIGHFQDSNRALSRYTHSSILEHSKILDLLYDGHLL